MNPLSTLIRFATENVEARPPEERAQIYEALAELLPNREDRVAAERLAFAIRETNQLQLDFLRLLKSPHPTDNGPQTGI